ERPAAVSGRHDAGDALKRRLLELLLHGLRALRTREIQIHDVDVELEAVVERLEQVAALPAREQLEHVDLRLGRESAHRLARFVPSGDDASGVRAVADEVLAPAVA